VTAEQLASLGNHNMQDLGCPEHLYLKKPTANLEDLKPGLPDEEARGLTYVELDDCLEGHDMPKDKIIDGGS
jgi:NAD+ synthase